MNVDTMNVKATFPIYQKVVGLAYTVWSAVSREDCWVDLMENLMMMFSSLGINIDLIHGN